MKTEKIETVCPMCQRGQLCASGSADYQSASVAFRGLAIMAGAGVGLAAARYLQAMSGAEIAKSILAVASDDQKRETAAHLIKLCESLESPLPILPPQMRRESRQPFYMKFVR